MSETHQLTELQIAVMRVLWEKGEATVAEIWEALRPERGLAQTTVATLLCRLEKRGVVAHTSRASKLTSALPSNSLAIPRKPWATSADLLMLVRSQRLRRRSRGDRRLEA